MEGVGSRLGRSSSRYGPSATSTVLNGPVRKWKRKWVHVSPSPTLNYRNNSHSNGHNNNNNNNNNNGSRLLLCRWTPLPPSAAAAAAATSSSEDPPKRKFRYTPIAVLEERSKVEKKVEQEVEKQLVGWLTSKDDRQNIGDGFKSETQVMHSGFGIRSVTSVLSKRVLIHGSEMNDISFGEMSKQVFSTISLLVSKNWNLFPLQDSNMSHLDLDLDLRLKGLNSDLDSVGQSEEDQVKKASSGGFWTSD
ncbi:hypothetical protein POTOM_006337 [Populus tomentosa]|uniref:Uncharacterized protein n=1 Tax=Populus tomentosa TaxID=118781 RepID=A0A8X8DFZ2_POPTO|nr:hypothetical protein POTOM_006337 [Populus tomentosa]